VRWICKYTGARNMSAAQHERTGIRTDIGSGEFEHNEKHGDGACLRGDNNINRGGERREAGRTKSDPHGPNKASSFRRRGVQQGASRRAASGERMAYLLLHNKLCATSAPHRVPAPPFEYAMRESLREAKVFRRNLLAWKMVSMETETER
jgi:hypothetical protein